ncbi:helix-turn-helix domain-containing protein [Micromonospora sp. 15K316]|uniref:AraC-like ligand-binding domain-containing protein n=1 Tax=Micromonospora sp. 15K316 TaxID=2530376 RepID=UPI00104AE31C|nr:helix-turn-helix domain-containing protein [Micromonospora sp. 15K316]TDC31336.1 helix-turn-helix domain-containing protein [Micromonospora sp. 15K316]
MAALRVETLDTTVVAPADRFPLWVEMADRVSAPVAFTSDHAADFHGHARMIDVGGVGLTRFRYQSLVGRRTPRLIRQADPEVYQIALATSGNCAISASRRDTAVPVGDFTLVDWGRPHDLAHTAAADGGAPAASVTAVIPRALLPLDADKVDRLTAARLCGSTGPGALLAQHLHRVTRHPEEFRASDAPYLADVTLSLVSALLARHLDAEDELPADVRQRALLARVRDFLERHLDDPQLSPQVVADAHHISLRTLHRLFEAEEETVAGTIRRRRLERCRRDLADPLLRHRPVHLVGRRWGFTDRAHFSRAFRAAYGMGPQAYRASAGASR